MDQIKKESVLLRFSDIQELNAADRDLLLQAREAVKTSYAPYSKFQVGCALLLANGEIIKGSNQENIAYPSGLCAERVAIFYAGATYPKVPVIAMAITAKADEYIVSKPVMSCGACLQSICEYEVKFNNPIRSILQGETGDIYISEKGTEAFLPFSFFISELKNK